MHRAVRFGATVLAIAGAVAAVPERRVAERPPAGFSGGFGEPSCVHCHIGNDVNAFGGRVRILGLPERYVPGERYALTVELRAEETVLAGFQMTARWVERSSQNAGELIALDVRTSASDSLGIRYLHHTRDGARSEDSAGSTWSMTWVAPTSGGAVRFNVAANSGNGDDSPLGDLVFVDEVTIRNDS